MDPILNAVPAKRDESSANGSLPTTATRSFLSLWIVVHFGLLAISLSTLFGITPLQERLIGLSSPYLSPTHLRLDSRPLDLAQGQPGDWRHKVQWRENSTAQWQTITAPRNWFGNDVRLNRFASVIAAAAAVENTPTASMLAMPLAQQVVGQASEDRSALQMRIVAYVPSALLQQAFIETHGGVIDASSSTPVIELWRAAIILDGEQPVGSAPRVSLVMVQEDRLNALPQAPASPPESTEGQQ